MDSRPAASAFLFTLGLLSACQMTKPAAPASLPPAAAATPASAAPLYQSAAFTLYSDRLM